MYGKRILFRNQEFKQCKYGTVPTYLLQSDKNVSYHTQDLKIFLRCEILFIVVFKLVSILNFRSSRTFYIPYITPIVELLAMKMPC